MTEYSLTARQADALACIEGFIAFYGKSPSFDEIRDALGLKSKSGVHRLVTALVERGHLIKLDNRARSLALPNAAQTNERDMHLVRALADLTQAKTSPGWVPLINSAIEQIEKARKA